MAHSQRVRSYHTFQRQSAIGRQDVTIFSPLRERGALIIGIAIFDDRDD